MELLSLLAAGSSSSLPVFLFEQASIQALKIDYTCDSEPSDLYGTELTGWHVRNLPSMFNFEQEVFDSYRLFEAVRILKASALVTMTATQVSAKISMHPLIHAWARDRQTTDQLHRSWLAMASLVALAAYPQHSTLLPQLRLHVDSVMSWPIEVMFGNSPPSSVVRILLRCGEMLYTIGRLQMSIASDILRWLDYTRAAGRQ